ncbi:hypothetical protein CTI14_58255, partial [Methylobacterium radiotolerans]
EGTVASTDVEAGLTQPGRSGGLRDVYRNRFLLKALWRDWDAPRRPLPRGSGARDEPGGLARHVRPSTPAAMEEGTVASTDVEAGLTQPGRSGGLRDVYRNRFLL